MLGSACARAARAGALLASGARSHAACFSSAPEALGFVGLGIMGDGMSRNLLKDGRSLVVWNRSRAKSEALKGEYPEQVSIATSPKAVIETCNLTYAMLSTPDVVREVYEMKGGVLEGVSARKAIVDCATLAVEDMERVSGQVMAKGGYFLEAPVSGSKGPAAAGELIFLCAGDEKLYSAVATDLDAMGKAKFFFGKVGNGTRCKLCVNMTMGTMLAAYGEGFGLAQASGLDPTQLLEVLKLGVCMSPLLAGKGAKMIAGDHDTNFPLKHAEKDMGLAVELGANSGLALPLAVAADAAMYAAMEAPHSLAEKDFSATYEAQKTASKQSLESLRYRLQAMGNPVQQNTHGYL